MKPSPALLIIVVVSLLAATHVDARESATPLRDLSTYGGIRAAERILYARTRDDAVSALKAADTETRQA